jgi:excisionase family DNA binding protein
MDGEPAAAPTAPAARRGRVNGRLTITDVAEQLGISVKTITRWEKAGKIRRARRDWRGWRVYAPEDIVELRGFFETVY